MTYEHNESHFFDVKGISQIKTHSFLLANKDYDGKVFHADLLVNLTYFDNDLKENFTNLNLPISVSLDDYHDDFIEVKNVFITVVDNQGVNIEFVLEVTLSEEIVEIEKASINETLDEMDKISIQEEYQANLEEAIKTRDGNVCISNEKIGIDMTNLKTTYRKYRLLFVDDEKKIDAYSNTYHLSMQELYQAKKQNQRLIVDVDTDFS